MWQNFICAARHRREIERPEESERDLKGERERPEGREREREKWSLATPPLHPEPNVEERGLAMKHPALAQVVLNGDLSTMQ